MRNYHLTGSFANQKYWSVKLHESRVECLRALDKATENQEWLDVALGTMEERDDASSFACACTLEGVQKTKNRIKDALRKASAYKIYLVAQLLGVTLRI